MTTSSGTSFNFKALVNCVAAFDDVVMILRDRVLNSDFAPHPVSDIMSKMYSKIYPEYMSGMV